jgi:hypothetical protein
LTPSISASNIASNARGNAFKIRESSSAGQHSAHVIERWPMTDRAALPADIRNRPLRRSARVNSRGPVLLEWLDATGARRKAEGRTRVVNFYGCLLVTMGDLPVGAELKLTNCVNNRGIQGKVVWRGNDSHDGWELGIELTSPDHDYWGLEI